MFGGPWFVLDHYLMISTWKSNFRPSINSFEHMSVWIRFSEFPVEYYDKESLFDIARVSRKPIRVDDATYKLTRERYARVCIEINLNRSLVTKLWVGGAWQQIMSENISPLCFACGKINKSVRIKLLSKRMKNILGKFIKWVNR